MAKRKLGAGNDSGEGHLEQNSSKSTTKDRTSFKTAMAPDAKRLKTSRDGTKEKVSRTSSSIARSPSEEIRPIKSNAAAGRMIAGALGMKPPKKTEVGKAYEKAATINLKHEQKPGKRPGKKPSKASQELETAADSDPIVESDTASQSGDDDGVSWPSDDDHQSEDLDEVNEDNETGGVKIAAEAANGTQSILGKTNTNGAPNGSSSKEAHAKQKVERQERKAAKPNADSVGRAKKLWEKLRIKSRVPKEERKTLVAELFDIISGHVKDFVFKHDSVRVLQTAFKYSDRSQKKLITEELRGDYKALAESKYAKFLVGKILSHGDDECRDKIVPEFYGHVRRLIKHPEASWILDDIYRGIATPSQKALLLSEWYGAEFALFGANKPEPKSADLQKLLAQHPEKRTPIMRSLLGLIDSLVQKKSTGFTMLHDAMLQYFLNVQHGSEERTNFIELIKGDEAGDLLKNLAFTKSGARLVCLTLAHGNAKDRKHVLRTFKDTMQMMAYDTHGHQVLMTAFDVIDDTVLVSKSIFPELVGKDSESPEQKENLLAAVTNLNARVSLLYPFCGLNKAILSCDDQKIIFEVSSIQAAHTTSKKDPEVRRKELINALSAPLLSLICSHALSLLSSSFGCQFIAEVVLSSTGDRQPAMAKFADMANGTEEEQALLETAHAGRLLKTLVLGGRYSKLEGRIVPVDPPLGFADMFYQAISNDAVQWATGCNSFAVVGLLEAPGFSKTENLRQTLLKHVQDLESVASDDPSIPAERKKQQKGGSSTKVSDDPKKGNKGTRLLLQKLQHDSSSK